MKDDIEASGSMMRNGGEQNKKAPPLLLDANVAKARNTMLVEKTLPVVSRGEQPLQESKTLPNKFFQVNFQQRANRGELQNQSNSRASASTTQKGRETVRFEDADEVYMGRERNNSQKSNVLRSAASQYLHQQSTITNNLTIFEEKPIEELFKGFVTIDRRRKTGVRIFSGRKINDQDLMDLLIYILHEKVDIISIPNSTFSDAGASILFEFLNEQLDLTKLKLCNNIMELVSLAREIPYLLTATSLLGVTLCSKPHLQVLELHGFFFHHDDYEMMFEGLSRCKRLKIIRLSNNNMQDYGVEQMALLIKDPTMNLEYLTLMNNNINDEGSIALADAILSEDSKL